MSLSNLSDRMNQISQNVTSGADKLVKETAAVIDQTVVLSTPVDTGRARANWRVGLNRAVETATENTDRSGSATISENEAQIQRRSLDEDIYISNNVDYIGELNMGSSAQAPEGFIESAVRAGIRFIRGNRLLS